MEWRDVLMLFFLLWISGKAALLNVHFNITFGQEQLLCWGTMRWLSLSARCWEMNETLFLPIWRSHWFEWLFNLWDAYSRKLLWSDCAHLSRQCLPTIHAQIWNVLTRKRQKGNLSMQRPILVGLSQSRKETKKPESRPNHGDVMTVSSLPQKEGFLTIKMCIDTLWWLLDILG